MKEVIKKLRFKPESVVINAPEDLIGEFVNFGCSASFVEGVKSSNTLVFVQNLAEFEDFLKFRLNKTESDSNLWFAYPKQSSGIKTNINRDILRLNGETFGIATVAAISVNDTWSALRFRPADKVGKQTKKI